ncbi:DUF418 domain-containing protein [Nocardia sp. NRRL S-836]|uniref:DUF418 domain-containing protein n=1 Tax=Nocardia sp. NRRL S-836 TaxID=1519492 RepID=UPI0006C4B66C|nr:DUF418 domain-containing protein [Nocardia sp. NRRL S-836]KOV85701.1 hypothetical protein ADL03_10400 [Nocardia sp. NRRL S-836]
MQTVSKRSLAPDLARGVMLMLIALSHAHQFIRGHPTTHRNYPTDGSTLDLAVSGLQMLTVDGQPLPLFAALFGYGLVQLAGRQPTWPAARWTVVKRCFWMIVLGALHAHFLFEADILGTYGVLGLVLVSTMVWRDQSLLALAGGWMAVYLTYVVLSAFQVIKVDGVLPEGLPTWGLHSVVWPAAVLIPVVLGMWAARHKMLMEPERHVRFLRNTAIFGIGFMIVGGLPLSLVVAQVIDGVPMPLVILHTLSVLPGGLGYAALMGYIAAKVKKPGLVMVAIAATGERSLTNYILQSVSWTLVFTIGGLGYEIGVAQASLVGLCTWLATVILSLGMHLAGIRGPLEVLLRFLTYGRRKKKPRPQAQPPRAMADQLS